MRQCTRFALKRKGERWAGNALQLTLDSLCMTAANSDVRVAARVAHSTNVAVNLLQPSLETVHGVLSQQ